MKDWFYPLDIRKERTKKGITDQYMASTADFRNGMVIEFNNDLYTIVQFQHVKTRKRSGFRKDQTQKHQNRQGD